MEVRLGKTEIMLDGFKKLLNFKVGLEINNG
jgi:hypothetical protein